MNLVDSCGWLEYFADGPNADFFAVPIQEPDTLVVPTICLSEVFRCVYWQRGEEMAFRRMAAMTTGFVMELDEPLAFYAGRLGVDLRLPFADSVILATARMMKATIWTQDADFKDIEGVKYIPRPS